MLVLALFLSMSGSPSTTTPLEVKLIERIEREGPITFRDFMEAALYDPDLGYYNTGRAKIGPGGDYYTSSNVHPAFGAVLARAFVELWPSRPLTIVEFGAGAGQLALDILTAIQDSYADLLDGLTYIIVERSPAMRTLQEQKLSGFSQFVRWSSQLQDHGPIKGVVFSNEFVDALPVHRVRHSGGSLEELYVTTTSSEFGRRRLGYAWAAPSTGRLISYVGRARSALAEGQVVEANLDAVDWLSSLAGALSDGFLVTIDYGDTAEVLYPARRLGGTVRCFHRHRLGESVLDRVGEQDITSSVNFTALIDYGRDIGFELISLERQTRFLTRMGLLERVSQCEGSSLKERLVLKNLFVPGGISDSFQVLIQRKTGQS